MNNRLKIHRRPNSFVARLFQCILSVPLGVLLALSVQGSAWSGEVYKFYSNVSLAPDGKEIVVQGYGRSGFGDVIQLDPESGGHVLQFYCGYLPARAQYVPDGSTIVVALVRMSSETWSNYPLLIGLDRETGESIFENEISAGHEYLPDMSLSPNGNQAYLLQGLDDDPPQVSLYDIETQQSTLVYESRAQDYLSVVSSSEDRAFVKASRLYGMLDDSEKESLGFPALPLEEKITLLYETTENPSTLRLSPVYPALRELLGDASEKMWPPGLVDEFKLEFRHQYGVSYVSFVHPDPSGPTPRFGIYRFSGETLDLLLDVGAPIDDFSVSPDGSQIAVAHRVPRGDGTFKLDNTITYFKRGDDQVWLSNSLDEALLNISKEDDCIP